MTTGITGPNELHGFYIVVKHDTGGMFLYRPEDDVVVQTCLEDRTASPVF